MALVFGDEGAQRVLEAYFNDNWPVGGVNLTLKLFVNDHTPADDDDSGDYTEAAGGGYVAKTLTQGSWTVAEAAGIMTATYAQQTFTFTGPLNGNAKIYGYYIVDADDNFVCAETIAVAFQPANNGDQLLVTPKCQASKGTPT